MTFTVHSLASGSSGNATLVRHIEGGEETSILIDAGLTVAGIQKAVGQFGVPLESLQGIVLTHEHSDHIRAAHAISRKFGVPLWGNEKTLSAVMEGRKEVAHAVVGTGARLRVGTAEIETFAVPHDAADPVGVNIYAAGYKVSQVTDAGCITPGMREAVRKADLLILEANHDVYRLKAGPYPDILKRRILSDRGHLSNEAAARFLAEHLAETGPCSLWLAHLSKTNNLPKLALNYARATLKLEARCPFHLNIAHRDKPSVSWTPGSLPVQLSLF